MTNRRPEHDKPGGHAGHDPKTGVNDANAHPREVRAGPGDAGRQDRPETLPAEPGDRRRGQKATMLLAALVVLGLIVWAVLSLAA